MISSETIQQFSDLIERKLDPIKIVLFGSHAKGTPNLYSDLDILVITNKSNVPRFKRGREIRLDLQRIADIDIDILVYTQQEIEEWKDVEFSFLNSILKTGKVIYEK